MLQLFRLKRIQYTDTRLEGFLFHRRMASFTDIPMPVSTYQVRTACLRMKGTKQNIRFPDFNFTTTNDKSGGRYIYELYTIAASTTAIGVSNTSTTAAQVKAELSIHNSVRFMLDGLPISSNECARYYTENGTSFDQHSTPVTGGSVELAEINTYPVISKDNAGNILYYSVVNSWTSSTHPMTILNADPSNMFLSITLANDSDEQVLNYSIENDFAPGTTNLVTAKLKLSCVRRWTKDL